MTKLRSFLKRHRGQSTVEMALILPILLVLLLGTFEVGRILGTQLLMENLAREGARNGAVGYDSAEIRALIESRRMWLEQSKLQITILPGDSGRVKGQPLKVQLHYDVDLIAPFTNLIFPNPVPLDASCDMRIE